ncbi:hypothetical protein GC207_10630 [bacterium]|nr:hypothetical protein [bacterium]
MHSGRAARWFVLVLAAWLVIITSLVTIAVWNNPVARAIIGMGWGLIILWIGVCGTTMYFLRNKVREWMTHIPIGWRVPFILFATFLALLEEAITTTMTNLAPWFGVPVGKAYITASTNYFDVVAMHSVVMFVPMFVAWQWMLGRWRFTPFQVFLLFGMTGTLAECSFGFEHVREFGMWIFVYGLMVWLPAYCAPENRNARRPRWWLFPLAVIIPILFIPLVPTPLLIKWIDPHHPAIHFAPPDVSIDPNASAN